MNQRRHDRTEVLAGAIILGEATDEERIEYRQHIAECQACLIAYGGEHELSRLNDAVGQARESEVWEPDVRTPVLARANSRTKRFARYGLGILAACLLVSLIGHFVVGSGLAQIGPSLADPIVVNWESNKIVLERRSVRDAKSPTPAPRMLVVHNIVQLPRATAPNLQQTKRNAPARTQKAQHHETEVALEQTTTSDTGNASGVKATDSSDAIQSAIPVWRRGAVAHPRYGGGEATPIGATKTAAITIAASYTVRDAAPEGGETALNPQPAQIAILEGAEGTSAFEVMIDETGAPTKCVITKASGWPVLDDAVCKAAMKIHYRPKMINGKPVPGVYRDAFTFRAAPQQEQQ
ncbi:MAG: TonB family protein [Candidatus Eremiobacteraeota bacterium]|nr:TonB family protein [Candidatus Eremiobacteraeota bacterium]